MKTKPTQHSVAELRSRGIHPDAIVVRSDRPIEEAERRKISLFCDVPPAAVINAPDAANIYEVPLILHDRRPRRGGVPQAAARRRRARPRRVARTWSTGWHGPRSR